jgi:hypothetical protein
MTMKHRHDRLAWAAASAGVLGLIGLASAQTVLTHDLDDLRMELTMEGMLAPLEPSSGSEATGSPNTPISDEGRIEDLPKARQFMLVKHGDGAEPLLVDLFNERGEIIEHVEWLPNGEKIRSISMEAMATGRYAIRISGAGRSEVVRFRKD